MKHSPGFLKLTEDAKSRIRETTVSSVLRDMKRGDPFVLIDIREDHEWDKGRAAGAIHLSRGIIERDIEKTVPRRETTIVLYCGGGFRSALAADNLGKMGYENVFSLRGGWKAWKRHRGPTEAGKTRPAPRGHR